MILPIKLVTSVLCILAKFRDFLKPVTMLLNACYTSKSSFDINHNVMFVAGFVLQPCNFLTLLLEKL